MRRRAPISGTAGSRKASPFHKLSTGAAASQNAYLATKIPVFSSNAIPPTLQSAATSVGARWWTILALIFLGRVLWWLHWGTLLEIDSVGYLHLQTTLYHPPLYNAFCWLAIRVGQTVDAVVFAQSLLYAGAAALFLRKLISNASLRGWLALVLAVEPCSGQLASTVMAETVFISLVLIGFSAFPLIAHPVSRSWLPGAIGFGSMMGLAYLTRYAAPVFIVAGILALALQSLGWRRTLWAAAVVIFAFQICLVPMRIYCHQKFGTWEFNGFSGLSQWNVAAHLYPGSDREANPQTDFEHWLQGRPKTDFDIYHTWHTNHIFHDSLPFQRYTRDRQLDTEAFLATVQSLGSTSRSLIAGAPLLQLRNFILPNAWRPFHIADKIHSDLLPPDIAAPIGRHFRMVHWYYPAWWWGVFLLLTVATGIHLRHRRHMPAIANLLLLSIWLYLLGISVLAVVFLRFVYVLAPLVVLVLGMQVHSMRRNSSSVAGPS